MDSFEKKYTFVVQDGQCNTSRLNQPPCTIIGKLTGVAWLFLYNHYYFRRTIYKFSFIMSDIDP